MAIETSIQAKATFFERLNWVFRRNVFMFIGGFILLVLLILAIFADNIAPNSPIYQELDLQLLKPFTNKRFPLGTDELGRCILSRIIHGTRISLRVAVLTGMLSALIGIPIGLLGGYSKSYLEDIIGRMIDIALATPDILIALALAAIFGRSLAVVMISISFVWWANYARLIRGQTLQIREMDYITAARVVGVKPYRIMIRHIFPNTIAQTLVMLSLNLASAILLEASLSFLGMGAQPPTPSWGSMLSTGRNYMQSAPWLSTYPGLMIVMTVLGFNLLGDGLRDILDPKLRGR